MARRPFRYIFLPGRRVTVPVPSGVGGLSDDQVAALGLTPAADYDYPSNVADLPIPAGFSTFPSSVWIVDRFAVSQWGVLQALFTLHSGNSVNVFGIRLSSSTNRPLFYIRAGNTDVSPATPLITLPTVVDIIESIGITWQISGGNITLRCIGTARFMTLQHKLLRSQPLSLRSGLVHVRVHWTHLPGVPRLSRSDRASF